jgi:hypothetical protein
MMIILSWKKLQAATEMQDLFSVVLRSDKNLDGRISESELDQFMIRMKAMGGRHGKPFDEEAARAAFKNSLTRRDISLFRIASSVMAGEEQDVEAQQQLLKVPTVHSVRSTGLVVPNTASMQSEGDVPKSIHGNKSTGGGDPNALRSAGSIPDVRSNESMLIDTLLSSNSIFEASKETETNDADGFLSYILKSFSGDTPVPPAREEEPQKDGIMMTTFV